MGLLSELLGGLQPREAQNFVQRYQQGAPSEGYSNQEVLQHFQRVAPQLSPQQFQQAAAQSFANMPPDQLAQFGQLLQQQAQQQGIGVPQAGGFQEPNALAQVAAQMHQQSPGLLGQLLGGAVSGGGGGVSGVLGSPAARAAMAGIAAMAMQNLMGGNQGGNAGDIGGLPTGPIV